MLVDIFESYDDARTCERQKLYESKVLTRSRKELLKFLRYVLDTSACFSAYLPVCLSVRMKQSNNRSKVSH